MFERIDRLVSEHDFTLKVWCDRYGKGVWAVCAPIQYQADEIQQASEDGDLEMIPATGDVLSTNWLPMVTGVSLTTALGALDERLAAVGDAELARGTIWAEAVCDALEHLRDVRRTSSEYGGTAGRYLELPETFQTIQIPAGG